MLAGKILTEFTNLFSPNSFKKNNNIILNYFRYFRESTLSRGGGGGWGGGGLRILQFFQKNIRTPGDHRPKYFKA